MASRSGSQRKRLAVRPAQPVRQRLGGALAPAAARSGGRRRGWPRRNWHGCCRRAGRAASAARRRRARSRARRRLSLRRNPCPSATATCGFQSSPPSSSSGRPALRGALVIRLQFGLQPVELLVGQRSRRRQTSAPEGRAALSSSALFQAPAALWMSSATAAASSGDRP